MNLIDGQDRPLTVSFPDVPGEEYRGMWEERRVGRRLAEEIAKGDLLLMVNGNSIVAPTWVMEQAELSKKIGASTPEGDPEPWDPASSPTQVQLVEMLQLLRTEPLDTGARKLAIMISAWDKAEGERLVPRDFLSEKLPLLDQYLVADRDCWSWRVYGVSAQGGDYDKQQSDTPSAEAENLRELELASTRIRVVSGTKSSHDLTEPLEWLIQ
jgi:hypothetical protein